MVAAAVVAVVVNSPVTSLARPLSKNGRTKLGIGWRPELAYAIARRNDIDFVEVVADDFFSCKQLPAALQDLQQRGIQIIPHCLSLSLGSAEQLKRGKIEALKRVAGLCRADVVSDHLCFVRAGGTESGHLLPVAYRNEDLEILIENIAGVKKILGVPLAVENIANLFVWPEKDYMETDFFAKVLERADVQMLLDVSNLHANAYNHGFDPVAYLDRLPLERLAYVHVAGGVIKAGLYHDTHAHAVPSGALSILQALSQRTFLPKVMLERDDLFPPDEDLYAQLDAIKMALGMEVESHVGN